MPPAPAHDQADALRSLAGRDGPPLIAVVGAKGGVGASTVALAIAAALADEGAAALDAHFGQADLACVRQLWWPHASLDLVAIADLLIDAPVAPRADAVDGLLEELAGRSESTVVVDAGPASSPWARALAPRARRTLLVATPDRLAALNAYAAAKRLRADGVEPWIVWNGCADAAAADAAQRRLDSTASGAGAAALGFAGWLPARAAAGDTAFDRAALRLANAAHPGARARRLEPTTTAAA